MLPILVLASLVATQPAGHTFILHTDIRYLACDAWLLPVGNSMHVDERWGLLATDVPAKPEAWGKHVRLLEGVRRPIKHRGRTYSHPQPWLAHAIGDELSVEELIAVLREYLTGAARSLAGSSRFGRALPLLAVPIFGAGLATERESGDEHLGELLNAMLLEVREFTATHAVDVALCTLDEAAFGAALNARRREDASFRERAPPDLDDDRQQRYAHEVTRLSEMLHEGRCSFFLGAGVSVNAGLPSWSQLLDLIAEELDYPAEDRTALLRLNPLEAASVLEGAAGGEASLKAITARIIGGAKRHSLQHALLAGLPFKGCVTTNYDDLLERAVRHAGDDLAVLPAEVGTVVGRWLLKLHGDVHTPSSIVLTRADYTRFSSLYAANEGVLQGLLLTQHVVFCGFSMRDENWCRLVDAVRSPLTRARRADSVEDQPLDRRLPRDPLRQGPAAGLAVGAATLADETPRLGTVLSLQEDRLFDSLWDGLLHVTPFDRIGPAPPEAVSAGGATMAWHARSLEIFLDYLASACENHRCRILLNPKYAALLSPKSKALSERLRAFLFNLDEQSKHSGAFQQILSLLMDVGLRTEDARRLMGDQSLEGPYKRRLSKLRAQMPSHHSHRKRGE